MPRTYSILLGEPSLLLREKIAGILARDQRIWCVTQVVGREALLRGAARIQPDFILADLAILNDPDALQQIKLVSCGSRVLALVDSISEPYENSSRRLGLDGIIEKGHVEQAILEEIAALDRNGDNINDGTS